MDKESCSVVIQKYFRGFLVRGKLKNLRRIELYRILHDWANGFIFKLGRRSDLSDYASQVLLMNAIFMATMPSRPLRNLPSVREITETIICVVKKKLSIEKKHIDLKQEYANRQRDRKDMLLEDKASAHFGLLDAVLKTRLMLELKEKVKRISEEKQEELKRKLYLLNKNIIESIEIDLLRERIERENMFRQEYRLRRKQAKMIAAEKFTVAQNREIMIWEDGKAHELRRLERLKESKVKVILSEYNRVKQVKLKADLSLNKSSNIAEPLFLEDINRSRSWVNSNTVFLSESARTSHFKALLERLLMDALLSSPTVNIATNYRSISDPIREDSSDFGIIRKAIKYVEDLLSCLVNKLIEDLYVQYEADVVNNFVASLVEYFEHLKFRNWRGFYHENLAYRMLCGLITLIELDPNFKYIYVTPKASRESQIKPEVARYLYYGEGILDGINRNNHVETIVDPISYARKSRYSILQVRLIKLKFFYQNLMISRLWWRDERIALQTTVRPPLPPPVIELPVAKESQKISRHTAVYGASSFVSPGFRIESEKIAEPYRLPFKMPEPKKVISVEDVTWLDRELLHQCRSVRCGAVIDCRAPNNVPRRNKSDDEAGLPGDPVNVSTKVVQVAAWISINEECRRLRDKVSILRLFKYQLDACYLELCEALALFEVIHAKLVQRLKDIRTKKFGSRGERLAAQKDAVNNEQQLPPLRQKIIECSRLLNTLVVYSAFGYVDMFSLLDPSLPSSTSPTVKQTKCSNIYGFPIADEEQVKTGSPAGPKRERNTRWFMFMDMNKSDQTPKEEGKKGNFFKKFSYIPLNLLPPLAPPETSEDAQPILFTDDDIEDDYSIGNILSRYTLLGSSNFYKNVDPKDKKRVSRRTAKPRARNNFMAPRESDKRNTVRKVASVAKTTVRFRNTALKHLGTGGNRLTANSSVGNDVLDSIVESGTNDVSLETLAPDSKFNASVDSCDTNSIQSNSTLAENSIVGTASEVSGSEKESSSRRTRRMSSLLKGKPENDLVKDETEISPVQSPKSKLALTRQSSVARSSSTTTAENKSNRLTRTVSNAAPDSVHRQSFKKDGNEQSGSSRQSVIPRINSSESSKSRQSTRIGSGDSVKSRHSGMLRQDSQNAKKKGTELKVRRISSRDNAGSDKSASSERSVRATVVSSTAPAGTAKPNIIGKHLGGINIWQLNRLITPVKSPLKERRASKRVGVIKNTIISVVIPELFGVKGCGVYATQKSKKTKLQAKEKLKSLNKLLNMMSYKGNSAKKVEEVAQEEKQDEEIYIYDFIEWGKSIKTWYANVVKTWFSVHEAKWKERHLNTCLSSIQRMRWLLMKKPTDSKSKDYDSTDFSAFNGISNMSEMYNACKSGLPRNNGSVSSKNVKSDTSSMPDYKISSHDAALVYYVRHKADALDLMDIILSRSDVSIQVYDPTTQRHWVNVLTGYEADIYFGRHPCSMLARYIYTMNSDNVKIQIASTDVFAPIVRNIPVNYSHEDLVYEQYQMQAVAKAVFGNTGSVAGSASSSIGGSLTGSLSGSFSGANSVSGSFSKSSSSRPTSSRSIKSSKSRRITAVNQATIAPEKIDESQEIVFDVYHSVSMSELYEHIHEVTKEKLRNWDKSSFVFDQTKWGQMGREFSSAYGFGEKEVDNTFMKSKSRTVYDYFVRDSHFDQESNRRAPGLFEIIKSVNPVLIHCCNLTDCLKKDNEGSVDQKSLNLRKLQGYELNALESERKGLNDLVRAITVEHKCIYLLITATKISVPNKSSHDAHGRPTGPLEISYDYAIKIDTKTNPCIFTKSVKTLEEWKFVAPHWMQPILHWGQASAPEPFWRKLKLQTTYGKGNGEYAQLHEKNMRVDYFARKLRSYLFWRVSIFNAKVNIIVESQIQLLSHYCMELEDNFGKDLRKIDQAERKSSKSIIKTIANAVRYVARGFRPANPKIMDTKFPSPRSKLSKFNLMSCFSGNRDVMAYPSQTIDRVGIRAFVLENQDVIILSPETVNSLMKKAFENSEVVPEVPPSWVEGYGLDKSVSLFDENFDSDEITTIKGKAAATDADSFGVSALSLGYFPKPVEGYLCGGLLSTIVWTRVVSKAHLFPRGEALLSYFVDHEQLSDARNGYLLRPLCDNSIGGINRNTFARIQAQSGRRFSSERTFDFLTNETPVSILPTLRSLYQLNLWSYVIMDRYNISKSVVIDAIICIQCWFRCCRANRIVANLRGNDWSGRGESYVMFNSFHPGTPVLSRNNSSKYRSTLKPSLRMTKPVLKKLDESIQVESHQLVITEQSLQEKLHEFMRTKRSSSPFKLSPELKEVPEKPSLNFLPIKRGVIKQSRMGSNSVTYPFE